MSDAPARQPPLRQVLRGVGVVSAAVALVLLVGAVLGLVAGIESASMDGATGAMLELIMAVLFGMVSVLCFASRVVPGALNCPGCGVHRDTDAKFCRRCGTALG